jgi:hypothetical protein
MEFTLGAVTFLSLLIAVAMGVVTWRLVREERRRSAARLAALAEELRQGGTRAVSDADTDTGVGAASDAARPGIEQWREDRPLYGASARPPVIDPGLGAPVDTPFPVDAPAPSDRLDALDATDLVAGGLFGQPVESTSTVRGRLGALGAAAAVVVTVVAAALFLLSGGEPGEGAPAAGDARPPVELLALEHDAQESFLAITGSVRNPAAAAAAHRLSVVATTFDEAGTLVARRRAPVDERALLPGGTSPFAIQVPAAGVSRYRISFLLDEKTIPHIDRRPAVQSQPHQGASS